MPVISALGMGGSCPHRARASCPAATRWIPGRAVAAVTLTDMKVLVTGGAGYIGSTTAQALEEAGPGPGILDSPLSGPLAVVGGRGFFRGGIPGPELRPPVGAG